MQTENNRRFDALQTEINTLQAESNRRFDAMQSENNRRFDGIDRRFDQLLEALRDFEGRITRLEEKMGLGANVVE